MLPRLAAVFQHVAVMSRGVLKGISQHRGGNNTGGAFFG
jgi:hypothetical protein